MWSRDKWKTYLRYHDAYGQQTCHSGDILQGSPTRKFEWLLNEVVLWGHVTN